MSCFWCLPLLCGCVWSLPHLGHEGSDLMLSGLSSVIYKLQTASTKHCFHCIWPAWIRGSEVSMGFMHCSIFLDLYGSHAIGLGDSSEALCRDDHNQVIVWSHYIFNSWMWCYNFIKFPQFCNPLHETLVSFPYPQYTRQLRVWRWDYNETSALVEAYIILQCWLKVVAACTGDFLE